MERLVPIEEFCKLACIKRTKAFALIRDREVSAIRIGRKTHVTTASIEALIQRRLSSERR